MKESKEVERTVLPIDEHEAEFLDAVDTQRLTIILGETGCGKSSRAPVMLLRAPPPDPSMKRVKMFISQPRRMAAKSLVERVRSCEPELRDFIALRMGHGVRGYETSKTRAWFVTTGYLVRLLENVPENFDACWHLIIDEVGAKEYSTIHGEDLGTFAALFMRSTEQRCTLPFVADFYYLPCTTLSGKKKAANDTDISLFELFSLELWGIVFQ